MKKKTIIIYYSWSGNTRTVAQLIQDKMGGQLFELLPVNAYPDTYSSCTERAKKEIQSEFMPELLSLPKDLNSYDVVFIGSPNWWSTMAPPVLSFLKLASLKGKIIVPFITHGGGGKGRYEDVVKNLCQNSTVLDVLDLYGRGGITASSEIDAWLKRIKILKND